MTILLGYVPRPEGRAALSVAIAEALRRGDNLLVVNTSRGESYVDASLVSAEVMRDVEEILQDSGIAYEIEQTVSGTDPAVALLRTAAEKGVSLIVIGLRRRRPSGKFLFGSNAQQVLLEADCPVLAVKAGLREEWI